MEQIIEDIDKFKSWIEDDIVFCIYKKDCIITFEDAKKMVQARLKAQKGASYPGLAYVAERVTITPDARKYFANEGYEGVTKVALITLSPLKVIIANIFIKIDKPLKPTRLFTNKEEAVRWLKKL
ncbi:MAG: STAS/SEC14 domain-containing protein [Cytophagales bacterium]|nr:STAS/SEC14 domain-containing protein [Cytophaga sp.]